MPKLMRETFVVGMLNLAVKHYRNVLQTIDSRMKTSPDPDVSAMFRGRTINTKNVAIGRISKTSRWLA